MLVAIAIVMVGLIGRRFGRGLRRTGGSHLGGG